MPVMGHHFKRHEKHNIRVHKIYLQEQSYDEQQVYSISEQFYLSVYWLIIF